MEIEEILSRIAYDVGRLSCLGKPTIGITKELYGLISTNPYMEHEYFNTTLFGCKIKCIGNKGLLWIVGYMGSAESVEQEEENG